MWSTAVRHANIRQLQPTKTQQQTDNLSQTRKHSESENLRQHMLTFRESTRAFIRHLAFHGVFPTKTHAP